LTKACNFLANHQDSESSACSTGLLVAALR